MITGELIQIQTFPGIVLLFCFKERLAENLIVIRFRGGFVVCTEINILRKIHEFVMFMHSYTKAAGST